MTNQEHLEISLANHIPSQAPRDAVAVCLFAGDPWLSGARGETLALIEQAVRSGEFTGKEDESLMLYAGQSGRGAKRLLLLGLGARDGDGSTALRRAAGTAVRQARERHIQHLYFILPAAANRTASVRAVAAGAVLGAYDGGFHRASEEDRTSPGRLTIVAPEDNTSFRSEIERARIIAEAANWARRLADEPGANLPPREFARRAAEMAAEFGLQVESLGAREIREQGMGALWGVGQGSSEEPALIVIRYEPERAAASDELWSFVGKGITFDTGGISLKHGLDMFEMKSDMAGGAAVLGALRAIAQLKPRRRIVGIVPSAENMPSGRALKPGDIVRTLAGRTIEVVDTDAEGRLVLADGIAYARKLGAARIVDLATLTGSIIVALGDHRAGLFSNHDEWAQQVQRAAARAGEPVWRMPISDDYRSRIESAIADFKNYGGRPDAISAALLLSKFAADTPWVHLDIAGTAWKEEATADGPGGATGAGAHTLVELACGEGASR